MHDIPNVRKNRLFLKLKLVCHSFLKNDSVFKDGGDISEGEEKKYSHTEKDLEYFILRCLKRVKSGAFNQVYESPLNDNCLKILRRFQKSNMRKIPSYSILYRFFDYI